MSALSIIVGILCGLITYTVLGLTIPPDHANKNVAIVKNLVSELKPQQIKDYVFLIQFEEEPTYEYTYAYIRYWIAEEEAILSFDKHFVLFMQVQGIEGVQNMIAHELAHLIISKYNLHKGMIQKDVELLADQIGLNMLYILGKDIHKAIEMMRLRDSRGGENHYCDDYRANYLDWYLKNSNYKAEVTKDNVITPFMGEEFRNDYKKLFNTN